MLLSVPVRISQLNGNLFDIIDSIVMLSMTNDVYRLAAAIHIFYSNLKLAYMGVHPTVSPRFRNIF